MKQREPVAGMIVLGALGTLLCGMAVWREWSPVAWWIGAGVVLVALVVMAWRRAASRRLLWVAGAVLTGLAVAAVPVLEPLVRPSAEVAWSVEGSEEPLAEASLPSADSASIILTVDDEQLVRARDASDGAVLWQHHGPKWEHYMRPRVEVAGDVVLIGADALADPGEEMVALDVENGDQLWSGPADAAPLVRNDSVLVVYTYDEDRGDVHRGLDLDTGEVQWTTEGSRGAWQSIPMGTPRPVVPFTEWVADDAGGDSDSGEETQHTVTKVGTGDQHVITGTAGFWSAGVVDDQLVVQETLIDPAEVNSGDTVPTEVTAYQLPEGDTAWEAELELSHNDWYSFDDERPQLTTFDSVHLQSSTIEGMVDVLDIRDGSFSQYQFPDGERAGSLLWSHEDVAVARADYAWSLIDLAGGEVAALPAKEAPYNSVAATAWLSGTAAPAWQGHAEGLFGSEYQHLTSLDLSDHAAPELVNLGVLPDGEVQGTYAGQVVLVDSEEIPDAANDEPQERTTAMHVLAPFG